MVDDELAHYGVIGMKWGHRKNPEKAFAKASAQLKKYEDLAIKYGSKSENLQAKNSAKIARAQVKLNKAQAKYNKQASKFFGNSAKKAKAQAKLAKAQAKYNKVSKSLTKSSGRAQKYQAKAAKWYGSMEKVFGTKAVSKLDNGKAITGKKYAEWYMNKRR